ncbi:MAG: hypothetical protein NUV56_04730 [Candidatus Uhrbacteria bacterium]|nr:hypothetical protein [Candidatus Uhrbacteria bacterium]
MEDTERVPVYTVLPESLNAWQLARPAVSSDSRIREGVARHDSVNQLTLEFLAHDQNPYVRQAVAEHERAPYKALMWLAEDDNHFVRTAVAGNKRTPSDGIHILANDDNFYVLRAAVRHPAARMKTLIVFARSMLPMGVLLQRDTLPHEYLVELTRCTNAEELVELGCDSRVPKEIVDLYWNSLSPHAKKRILDMRTDLREAFQAARPRSAAEELHTAWATVNDLQATADDLERCSHFDDPNILRAIGRHLNTGIDTLLRLAENPHVAKTLLLREVLSPALMLAISVANSSENITVRLAADTRMTDEALEAIMSRPNVVTNALIKIARRENAPPHLLDRLARHPSASVRAVVAANQATSIPTLEFLARDEEVAVYIAANLTLRSRAQAI